MDPGLDVAAFLDDLRAAPDYSGQMVHVHRTEAREAIFAEPAEPLGPALLAVLRQRGGDRLYSHQAKALDLARSGRDLVIATGTASGKSLGYVLPIIESLVADPLGSALLLFPTKALSQDQFRGFSGALEASGVSAALAGVYDGDTPPNLRRKLRDEGSVIFSNPDMLHAGMLAQRARWADFLSRLRWLVLDELHTYTGMFGSNVANLMRRFLRVCEHYGSRPQIIGCSATVANPSALAEELTGRRFGLIEEDGSPRGPRTFVFWNPPTVRGGNWRSRRSANVEAHQIMAALLLRGVPTIAFSKAKMTAELLHRYVCERLATEAPRLVPKVVPYRGGYLPEDRREIERRLFNGELLGVSTTPALELGIDVGGLDAAIVVGYPGTLASFFQQSGRAGRRDREAVVFLVGLDTSVNQYVMSNPDYIFGRPIEEAVLDADNPFITLGHLRCATHELPLSDAEATHFGEHAGMVLRVLEDNQKVRRVGDRWYHAASEIPQHEVSLRDYADRNVMIQDVDTQQVIGEVNKFDAQPIVHPGAIYMHQGDTYRVLDLDLERNLATVKRVEVDYYTQPLGGTDIHHIDHRLRERPFGTGIACWGEVTAHFRNEAYEKIHFYTLDAMSTHNLDLPTYVLETMAFWLIPPEEAMREIAALGKDPQNGLRGVGYATRMLLPMFMTCQTLDFSHTVGSANSPWHTVFVYERYPLGLGFTLKAYDMLPAIMPAVLQHVRECPCADGCPVCVGKPLRQYTTWNVERGEASIPSKAAAILVLEGLLGDETGLDTPDSYSLSDAGATEEARLEQALRRRLERMREPEVFHPIVPQPELETEYPEREPESTLGQPDVSRRLDGHRDFQRELRRRVAAKKEPPQPKPSPPSPLRRKPGGVVPPTAFPVRPKQAAPPVAENTPPDHKLGDAEAAPKALGDSLAAKARRLKRRREPKSED